MGYFRVHSEDLNYVLDEIELWPVGSCDSTDGIEFKYDGAKFSSKIKAVRRITKHDDAKWVTYREWIDGKIERAKQRKLESVQKDIANIIGMARSLSENPDEEAAKIIFEKYIDNDSLDQV